MHISRSLAFCFAVFLSLWGNPIQANSDTASLYQENGTYYVKSAPTWVPIGGTVFIIIPTYKDGDIVEIVRSGNTWVTTPITLSQFNAVNPSAVNSSSFQYTDVNGDGEKDFVINLPGEELQLQLLASASGEYAATSISTSTNTDWLSKGGSVGNQSFSASSIAPTNFYGQTGGSPSVSGGAAVYNIPIDVVPGRAGFQPSVSLQYSSRSGVGIAGVGWSMSASGAISRCAATLAQDNFIGAVKFKYTTDKLCLNGQRLMVVQGSYGRANSEYRLELDDNTRVFQRVGNTDSSTTYFEVKKADGSTSYYGKDSESRVSPSGTASTMSWLLTSTYDVSGKNHMSYKYTGYGAGERLLSTILYTGNGSSDGNRKVSFHYENKRNPRKSYLWGTYSESTKRLNYIDTFYGSMRVKRYDLSYSASRTSGRDLLTSVKECGYTNGTLCKETTSFNWSDDTPNIEFEPFSYDNQPLFTTEQKIEHVIPRGDINGDGVRDWKGFFVNAEGERTGTTSKTIHPCHLNIYNRVVVCAEGDFNKDGLTDDWRNNNGTLQIKYSSLNSNSYWFSTGIKLNKHTYYKNFEDDHIMHIADYNGDSWPDLMVYRFEDYENAKLWLYAHSGNINNPYSVAPKLVYTFQATGRKTDGSNYRPSTTVQFMGDMDGDNTPDIMVASINSDGKYSVNHSQPSPRAFLFNNGNGYSFTIIPFSYVGSGSNWGEVTHFSYFVDINGDGLQDWLGWKEHPSSDTESLLVAKINKGNKNFGDEILVGGDNFRVKSSFVFFPPDGDITKKSAMFGNALKVADINGDGIPEILEPGERLVTGCGRVTDYNNSTTTRCGNNLYGVYRTSSTSVADINASILDDSIYRWNAFYFNEDSNGNISLTKRETDYVGHAYQSAFVDSHGKGLPDLVSLHVKSFPDNSFSGNGSGTEMSPYFGNYGAYYSRNKGAARGSEKYLPHDLMESVSAPKGISASWKYRPLSSDEYDKSGVNGAPYYETDFDYTEQLEGGEGEYLHFASSMYSVAEFNVDNGIGGQNKHLYRYKGAVFNTQGRGFMGFREIIHENQAASTLSSSVFEQMFPKVGLVESASVTQLGDSEPFTTTDNKWVITSAHTNSSTFKVHNERQEVRTYDVNALPQELSSTIVTVNQQDVDKYGNVRKSTTVKEDDFSETTVINTASYSATDAWPHKLTGSTVEKRLAPRSSSVLWGKSNTFTKVHSTYIEQWDNTHRKPKKVITNNARERLSESSCFDSANSKACSVVTTDYNVYGLPTTVQTKGKVASGNSSNVRNVQIRKVTTTYSDNGTSASGAGYFPYSLTTENGNYDTVVTTHTSPYSGAPVKVVDANGLTSTSKYDSLFRPIEVKAPGVSTQSISYASADSARGSNHTLFMVSTKQAGAQRTKQYIDRLGRTLRTATEGFSSGQWYFTDKRYNALGQVTQESLPHTGTPVYTQYTEYDVLGRLKEKLTPAVNSNEDFSTTYSYNGFITEIRTYASDGHNLVMSRVHDSAGLLMQTNDAQSGVTEYGYDAQGNPVVIKDAANNEIVAHYDNWGRKLWVDDPNQGKTTFVYNTFGELESESDANGKYQRYDYDLLGRVVTRFSSNGNASYIWDTRKKGLLTKSYVSGASKEFFYDSLARPTEVKTVIDGAVYSTRTAYNPYHGYVKSLTYPNGMQVAMDYNSRGYLTTERNAASGYVYRTVTEQDSFGNIKKASIADGRQQGEYLYSTRTGQMLMSRVTADGGAVHYLDYNNYDSYGNLRSQVNRAISSPQTDTYTYDSLHRLTRSSIRVGSATTTIDYGYDAVGNLKKKTDYSVNSNSAYAYFSGSNKVKSVRLKNGGTDTFGYDNKGNLTKLNNVTEFTYNVMNKPTAIKRKGSQVSLAYDADWARYKQVRTVDGKIITTHYVDKLYEVEKEGSKTTNTAYISDAAIVVEGTDQKKIRFSHRDRLGSATTLIDHNNNVMAYRFFDPFGKPRMGDGSLMQSFGKSARLSNNLLDVDMATRRGFTDHEHLDEVEIIHMNGRVYDYNLGRFMSVDPFVHGGSQGINPYSYILNNPLSGTDPSGYTPVDEVDKIEISKVKQEKVAVTGSRIKRHTKTTVSGSVSYKDGTSQSFKSSYNSGNGASSLSMGTRTERSSSIADTGNQESIAKSDWTDQQGNPSGTPSIFNGTETACVCLAGGVKNEQQQQNDANAAKALDGFISDLVEAAGAASPPPPDGDEDVESMRQPTQVKQFNNTIREDYYNTTPFRKLVYHNGKWKTVDGAGNMFTARGEYEFVTIRGNTYVGRVGTGHYNISHGSSSVDYAGHIRFTQGARSGRGQLRSWNNNSGHYKPTPDRAWQARLPMDKFTRY